MALSQSKLAKKRHKKNLARKGKKYTPMKTVQQLQRKPGLLADTDTIEL